ncbi:MAG TPA: PH domain-containing protein [Polyangiaceae bacterium]|nr:PH domain-containing protein [Polyangiaceae bacterium]
MNMQRATEPSPPEEEVLFEGRPALIPSVGVLLLAIVTLGLWLLPRWWRSLGVHYRLTTRRVVVETGVLSKRMEQIDLYRVNDYTVDRPFFQRLLGTGNLSLKTFDKTTPELRITEIKTDVVALYERLRQATEKDRAARGVRMVDYET